MLKNCNEMEQNELRKFTNIVSVGILVAILLINFLIVIDNMVYSEVSRIYYNHSNIGS
ncbi:hypothetical protein [Haloimpatiens lingqiaonensis]|uniref:hypothetical protein n=1 Tax=Haloimpatiens lingqiaonensis TaxID=1380675 RepID=UPI001485B6F0|nr:hypothetical protein [Haloimpatiens lingqiaonensis]